MTAGTLMFLSVRVLHVLVAALWFGAAVFITFILSPVVENSGAAGGTVMGGLGRRGLHTYMAILSGLTLISGIWLYWRFTGGFDPAVSRSTAGLVFGAGGLLGIIAGIVGGSVIGRGGQQMMALGDRIATLPDGPEKGTAVREMQAIGARIATASRFVVVCMTMALALMALGHYV